MNSRRSIESQNYSNQMAQQQYLAERQAQLEDKDYIDLFGDMVLKNKLEELGTFIDKKSSL